MAANLSSLVQGWSPGAPVTSTGTSDAIRGFNGLTQDGPPVDRIGDEESWKAVTDYDDERNDPSRSLPAPAAAKYAALRRLQKDLYALVLTDSKEIEEERGRIARQRTTVAEIEVRGGSNSARFRVESAKMQELLDRFRGPEAEFQRRAAQAQSATALFNRVQSYARRHGKSLKPVEVEIPAIARDQFFEAVDRCRARIGELRAEIGSLRIAPYPSALCKRLARQQIESLAAAGAPDCSRLLDSGGSIDFPRVSPYRISAAGVDARLSLDDVLPVVAWLFKDQLLAAIDKEIETLADDETALAPTDRKAKIAALETEILSQERREEALIEAAAAASITIARRPDADVRAVLGVDGPAPKDL